MSSSNNYFGEQMPSYPPQTHASMKRKEAIAKQPAPAQNMSVQTPQHPQGEGNQPAARLRGGCIPCPDGGCCFIIPCPCC
ncbi:hypothetical protein GALMADRAFT_249745 [Galerina marginata CBS 339.88]|uniref:Uncharacterized protein n=1 Tax=Galerina marginata (strain CBS 339.88) TaxID=685588 RepID=A0A067SV76_GALM3|nr:hypothetical protein GALMADRAFT_249745 [Galerina marginata CBS 339.88]